MPCVAEFGIIDNFDKNKDYSSEYEPQKYNCIAIDDDIIDGWWNELVLIKTYFHNYNRPEYALARWGVTLIPPESLDAFYNIITNDNRSRDSKELANLMALIRKAIRENKYVIHYGV
ncbi:hypothetical protein [Maledivibacter halophilus]|uniref:Uncharacterized protein n=1 Tax=Maledivibacter halophilus TaxID=36842 RepID=A0A1T5LDD8_9FIRM|nr:hypothetical protein [Maledivibacter halophilus]SKC73428.1 hypothetical protein SAMN02194393_02722 [Maledivibacter halophilus]